MSDQTLRVEAVASTILLSAQSSCESSLIDLRPGLLAAQLSAHKLCSASGEHHRWQKEFGRVLALLGWRQAINEKRDALMQGRKGWVVHEMLARGIAKQCSAQWALPIKQAMAKVAAAPEDCAAVRVLRAYGWHGTGLNLQVALLDTNGSLTTFGIRFKAHDAVPAQWLSHRFQPSVANPILHTRVTGSQFSSALYEPVVQGLKTRLGDRLHTDIAAF